ncbi:hypothetical protein A3D62_01510 [Candidatus Kaiserbacteria bacterium RIFCSPHIGHO2_02_FULL_49_11]|uniref:Uncharacterized protein n=1 Tax=Candidatus Kaiserbacteria bacterium RIFCSPHIGHO2_02_FULL_49_11 TaxID=1798489 RepID=A0A1F6D1C9_9BACT|nr:MAG: hypothetical protein A3D62_01510 [Candidatus Kaiserbacteria bacterium RIFCSPHIGHO2_02_FULL_49_11]
MKFFTFFINYKDSKENSSEFSRFFREASSREKKKVFLEVARKASADQQKIIESARPMQPAN